MLGEGALNEVFLKGFTCVAETFALGQIFAVRGVQIEVGRGDLGFLCHQHRPFDPVLEFPHIPWPTIRLYRVQCLATEPSDFVPALNGIPL